MKRIWFISYILLIVFFFGTGLYQLNKDKTSHSLPQLYISTLPPALIPSSPLVQKNASGGAEIVTVKRVIDGDTIELADGRRVRYIGVDTPELHSPTKAVQCYGQEAMEKNKELVEGKKIRMKKDVSETDRYKRLLRYVWIDGIFVNDYLVQEGFAHQATFPPDVQYVELFRTSAEEARIKNKGLWSACK